MSWLTDHISLHSNDTPREEFANAGTHLVGAVLAIVGTILLVREPAPGGMTAARSAFGAAMILLFSASTLYHMSPPGSTAKRIFRLMDHLSIFVLIAGTYTPVMTAIDLPWAYGTLAAVWALAITGMTLKVILWDKFGLWQVIFFLAMGWLAIIRIGSILEILPGPFFRLLLTGGIIYSLGTIVYGLKRLPYHHAVWHLFVLGGAGAFFWGVYRYL
jgi:hemolysin III